MARYPTFEEYAKKKDFVKGIERCDTLLKKNPNDVQLLTVKLQLCYASNQDGDSILNQLAAIQPPIQDLVDLVAIDNAVSESSQDVFPPRPTHPIVSDLWDGAFRASTSANNKIDIFECRFSRAVSNNRIADAQQALIQLKAYQPKNRTVYLAHAAYTQLLSTSPGDIPSRLALSLARKAVKEKFDDDKSLDLRVPGQIFALQKSVPDLEGIAGRPFAESKQVYDAMRSMKPVEVDSKQLESTMEGLTIADPTSVPTREWLSAETAVLKTHFTRLVEANATTATITAFVANAARLSHTAIASLSLAHSRGVADACFLAVSGLVKLFATTNDLNYLLQAAYYAEQVLLHNRNVHEARLVLIYIYMRLNLGSLAMRLFDSLNIKEVQYDTIGHSLFTGLSIIHPFATQLAGKALFDPWERTQRALAVYPRHEEKLADTETNVMNHGQTGMIFDLIELRSRLRASVSKRIFVLEHRRAARLMGKEVGKGDLEHGEVGERHVANWIQTVDNRDFKAAFDYGFDVDRALHERSGAVPGRAWVGCTLAAETAWSLANGQTFVIDDENLASKLNSKSTPAVQGLTSAEYLAGKLALLIIKMMRHASQHQSIDPDDIKAIQTAMNNLHIDALISATGSLAEHLPDHYLYIDHLCITVAACRRIGKAVAKPPAALIAVQHVALKHITLLQQHAKEQVARMSAAAVQARVLENEALRESMRLFGEEELHVFAQSVATSAKEGWEGVGKIAVKQW